jgi:2-polyprenyl-3-methyl-5-hydroxy-6-metoxy-1,4-benzoquinol methylase
MKDQNRNGWAELPYASEDLAGCGQDADYLRRPSCRNRLAAILELLQSAGLGKGAHILEIGCGSGNVAIALAASGYRVTAIDVHAPSIQAARARNPFSHCHFECVPVENMDLKEYDALVMTEVLEHVVECNALLNYLANSSRQDACLVVTVPNGGCLLELVCRPSYFIKRFAWGVRVVQVVKKVLGSRDATTCDPGTPHVHFFRRKGLLSMFSLAGYRIERWHQLFWLWPVWEILFSERKQPAKWARNDFKQSQYLPACLCTWWAFCLRKDKQ